MTLPNFLRRLLHRHSPRRTGALVSGQVPQRNLPEPIGVKDAPEYECACGALFLLHESTGKLIELVLIDPRDGLDK